MLLSQAYYFFPLGSSYSPQPSVLIYAQAVLSLSVADPYRRTIKILYILIFTLGRETKKYELNGGKCSSGLICP
jgi:hypothetical protein